MTKPFEMMGREQFLKEVVSRVVFVNLVMLTRSISYHPSAWEKENKKFSLFSVFSAAVKEKRVSMLHTASGK